MRRLRRRMTDGLLILENDLQFKDFECSSSGNGG